LRKETERKSEGENKGIGEYWNKRTEKPCRGDMLVAPGVNPGKWIRAENAASMPWPSATSLFAAEQIKRFFKSLN
jgi:hypothetical protein